MKVTLQYQFQRKSKSYLDWLGNTIKSDHYYTSDAIIIGANSNNRQK